MNAIRLGLRFLRRDWRSGELSLLVLALIMAVTSVTGITLFADRLQRAIVSESGAFLAADRQLVSPRPVPQEWLEQADSLAVAQARILEFASMLQTESGFQLGAIKAVTDGYPLKGQLLIADAPFAEGRLAKSGPQPGEVWLISRLFPILNINVGDRLTIGNAEFIVSRALIREPDGGASLAATAPRVMMNWRDVAATGVVQPGSRLTYRYLFQGDDGALNALRDFLAPQLTEHHEWVGIRDGRPSISTAVVRAERFLLLGGSLVVVLAGIAIAMSARRFSQRHQDSVAVLKAMGMRRSGITRLFLSQLLTLTVVASLVAAALGWGLQFILLAALSELIPHQLPAPSLRPMIVGFGTGLFCMLVFALPPIMRLAAVSPLRVLRRDDALETQQSIGFLLFAFCMSFALVWWYSQDVKIAAYLLLSIAAISTLFALVAAGLFRLTRLQGAGAGSAWRLALAAIRRRPWLNLTQVLIFSLALSLVFIIFLVRTALLDEWRTQIPENAPNHFILNIDPFQVDTLRDWFDQRNLSHAGLYPMVRGRLVEINGTHVRQVVSKETRVGAIERELNLTWSDTLPSDNRLLAGGWWQAPAASLPRVSVEAELADKLGIELGDTLTFTIAERRLQAEVSSVRTVKWDSMQPNFYMMFEPGSLDPFPATYLTSLHLEPNQKTLLNELLSDYPTLSLLEVDVFIRQIRGIIAQVGLSVEIILYLVLLTGGLVMLTSVRSSLDERFQEAAVIRTLGGSRRLILGSLSLEMGALGAMAGALAGLATELSLFGLQTYLLEIDAQWHPLLWVTGPVLGLLLVGGLGVAASRQVVNRAPVEVIRNL